MISETHNVDCMEFMAGLPDGFFDLVIADPPYGIGADIKNNGEHSKRHKKTSFAKINTYKKTDWDNVVPSELCFDELKRVSNRQIIWGANFFGLVGGMIYWHKGVTMPTYSTGELAWVSWLQKIDFVDINWHGMLQHDMKNKEARQHPTQKPVALYKWLLTNYAKPGHKIFDPMMGSQSSRIAAHDMGFDYWGCELDADYFRDGEARYKAHIANPVLFPPDQMYFPEQVKLF